MGCLLQILEESIIYIHRESQLGSKAKVEKLSLFSGKVLNLNEIILESVPEAAAHSAENLKRAFQRFKRIAKKPQNPLISPFMPRGQKAATCPCVGVDDWR